MKIGLVLELRVYSIDLWPICLTNKNIIDLQGSLYLYIEYAIRDFVASLKAVVDNARPLDGTVFKKGHLAFGGSSLVSITRTIRTKNSIDALLCTSTLVSCQAYSTAQIVLPLCGGTKGASNWFKIGGNVSSQWARTYSYFFKSFAICDFTP